MTIQLPDAKPQSSRPSSSVWVMALAAISTIILLVQLLPKLSSHVKLSDFKTDYIFAHFRPTHLTISKLESKNELDVLTNGLPSFSSIRVVSLPTRIDRRNHMKKLDRHLHLGFQFSDAILYSDPRVLEIVKQVGNHTKADNKIAEVGHVACRMSHKMAIQAADAVDDETTLILEDDVDFEYAFKYLSGTVLRDVPKDWDLIFFGHTDFSDEARNGKDPNTNNFFIYKSLEPQGGHAYAMSRKGRKLLLDLLDNKRPHVYETDQGMPIDEIFAGLARFHKAYLYSIIPDMVVQRPLFKSDILGTPAGFNDGMHNKPLFDSTLSRIKFLERKSNRLSPMSAHRKASSLSTSHRLSRSQ
ncbi:hypothetical protein O181_005518 [Austropuccinia psidii MF-1]|uniref:Glycosyl transferase family 25 domain-containing protein n=1 Tax=Austropuccinia psidii MF-1 TaxID=1389203 RepID=A0A9Q3GFM3_9BASI|nr:hypothetical protein [Austropuccinia psidii MF-1]